MVGRARRLLLRREPGDTEMAPPLVRWSALLWVGVSLPVIIATAAFFVDTPGDYVFVFVFMASGAYTAPALVAGWLRARRGPREDQLGFMFLYGGLVLVFTTGVGMLVGLATGWRWGNVTGIPIVVLAGVAHALGLWILVRRRSGRRAMSVDVIEAIAAVVALTAPLVVLWWPSVTDAEASWFAVPASLTLVFAIWATYWAILLCVRLGPGRGFFEVTAVGLAVSATMNAALQTAHGVSGFDLPAAPLIALHGFCMSMYLLIPLNTPLFLRNGLDRLPPQAQVRGARLATVVSLSGLAVLLGATALVADERPWAVPFSLGVVSLLFGLGGLRQMAAVGETRRLYRQVEEASELRRHLVEQLLERSDADRRDFAGQLYEQAVAAYASFRTLAGARGSAVGTPTVVDEASELVGVDLARQAESVRELMLALQPADGDSRRPQRLAIPITAYLTSIYEDRPAPRLTLAISEAVALDWINETMLLQIIREALDNVGRHSRAENLDLAVDVDDDVLTLRVTDDGTGFDPDDVPEGPGIATMRTSAAVIGGSLSLVSQREQGTTVTVTVDPRDVDMWEPSGPEPKSPPYLRLVADNRDDAD